MEKILLITVLVLCNTKHSFAWIIHEKATPVIDYRPSLNKDFYKLKNIVKLSLHKTQLNREVGPVIVNSTSEYSNYQDFYETGELLGSGHYGKVWKGTCKETNEQVAIKVMYKCSIKEDLLKKEIRILKMLPDDPHICKYYDSFEDEETITIILEFCGSQSLYLSAEKSREKNTKISEEVASQYIKQALEGLSALHKKGVYHRDVKLSNMVVDDKGTLKIIDFGVSDTVEYPVYLREGSDGYYSREMILRQPYRASMFDSWGIGISVYKLLFWKYPFGLMESNETLYSHNIRHLIYSLPTEPSPSNELISFLSHIFVKEKLRYSVDQLLQHKWIKKYNK